MQEQNSPQQPDRFSTAADTGLPPVKVPFQFSADSGQLHRFKFHGQAMEYFRIWIVNILLTIVTLSLYAPWAKVRRLRYFYANTEFFQRFFDFTGLPVKILYGRLIALGIWAAFAAFGYLEPKVAIFGFLFIYLAIPWLLRATLRFASRNSKYGNSRFYFEGTTGTAYKQFFLGLLIIIFTLGLFTPVAVWLYKRYTLDHLYAGQLRFKLNNSWSDYMTAVYVPVVLFIVLLIVIGVLIVTLIPMVGSGLGQAGVFLFFAAYLLGIIFVGPLIQARIFITSWNHTTLGQSQFETDCNQWRYAWIVASNWIVKLLSLGLMSAWAAIRLARYQIESLSLSLADDPDQMVNMLQTDHSAIAEEISDIFDLDISL
ncbi:YjgN family protein [Acinetobacter sp. WZC-1]|uniref:YjgN family protein n=1 Tax=Acinetobacter sp. WZC-1 TaxID=3459034 RepID=UPI00403E3257